MRRSIRLVLLVVSIVGLAVAGGIGSVSGTANDDLVYAGTDTDGDDKQAPNPYGATTLTKAAHPMEKGTDHDAMAGIYDDDGNWIKPGWEVNTTRPEPDDVAVNINPYDITATDIEDDDFSKFPRVNDSQSILNSSQWTQTQSGMTVSETQTADDVDAIRFDASGLSANDVGAAVYTDLGGTLDSDESKRHASLFIDVSTLSGVANITLEDEAGDTKSILLDTATNAGSNDVAADATGDGFVYQMQLAKLPGSSLNNIEKINVSSTGATDISLSRMDFEQKGNVTLGKERVADSDGDYVNTNKIEEVTTGGAISIKSISTMDSEFDDATLHDVKYPIKKPASLLEDEGVTADYQTTWESPTDPQFDDRLNSTYRIKFVDYIDASYGTIDIRLTQDWPSSRYASLGASTDVGSSHLDEISHTDKTSLLGDIDDRIELETGVSSGANHTVDVDLDMTEDERTGLEAGAAAVVTGDSGGEGGAFNQFQTIVLGLIGAIGVWKRKAIAAIAGFGGN